MIERFFGLDRVRPGSIGGAILWWVAVTLGIAVVGVFGGGLIDAMTGSEGGVDFMMLPLTALAVELTWKAGKMRGLSNGFVVFYCVLSVIFTTIITAIVLSRTQTESGEE